MSGRARGRVARQAGAVLAARAGATGAEQAGGAGARVGRAAPRATVPGQVARWAGVALAVVAAAALAAPVEADPPASPSLAQAPRQPGAAAGSRRPEAELACAATAAAQVYDCTLRLSRAGRPLEGVTVVAGADMPSMPMAHTVRPVTATPGPAPGEYRFRLALEMRGEWAVRLRLGGPVRDQLVLHYAFDGTTATPVRR